MMGKRGADRWTFSPQTSTAGTPSPWPGTCWAGRSCGCCPTERGWSAGSPRPRPISAGWTRPATPTAISAPPRTETLFAPPGTAYIYLIYGMYHCLNFVTEAEGEPAAVLIRGAVPAANGDIIAKNRFGCKMEEMSSYQRKKFSQRPGQAVPGTGAHPGGKRTGPHRSGRGAVCLSGRASGPRAHPRGQAHRNRLCGGGRPLPLAVLFINNGPPASSRGPLLFLLSSLR